MADPIKQLDLHPDKLSLASLRNTNNINYKKINQNFDALKDIPEMTETAIQTADQAKIQSQTAENKADSVQEQFNAVVGRETDSDAMSAQAAVDANGIDKGNLKKRLDEDYNEVTNILEETPKYPTLTAELGYVVRKDLPYGHVDRYGASIVGIDDCAPAIQKAIDVLEELGKGSSKEMPPIQFGAGVYVIRSTIKVKYDTTKSHENRPVTFKGVPIRLINPNPNKGTVIKPLIPNHDGKPYANAFAINVKYNSITDEDNTMVFGSQIVNNIAFEDISFLLEGSEIATYNINAIKAYRTRMKVKNLNFTGMLNSVYQPFTDRLGATSYCDFSVYEDINFKNIKNSGLTLCTPDNTSIKRITNHYLEPTFDNIINIQGGAAITLENIHSAMHGTFDSTGELVPRNDGKGVDGTKALIKLNGTHGVAVSGVYVERQFGDYMFRLENATNVKIYNHYERFVGNGFMYLKGICAGIKISNVYRHTNMLSEYSDFYFETGATLSAIDIKTFIRRDWYTNSFSLVTTDYRNSVLTQASNGSYRNIKKRFNSEQMNNAVSGEDISLIIYYDGATSSWKAATRNGKDLTSIVGTLSWDTDGLILTNSNLYPYRLISISPYYVSSTSLPYLPVPRQGVEKIHFMDIATATRINSPDSRMAFMITLNSVFNRKLFD